MSNRYLLRSRRTGRCCGSCCAPRQCEDDISFGDRSDELSIVRHDRQAFAVVVGEAFHRLGEGSAGTNHRKKNVQNIARNHYPREVRRVEVALYIVQRDSAEESSVVGHVEMVESRVDKLFTVLRETI